jgi:hypothetical protein
MAYFARYRTSSGAATLAAVLLVLVFGSPMYVSWVQGHTDVNTAGGWFMRLLSWPAWRFSAGDSVQNLIADDLRAILLILLTFVFLLAFAGSIASRAQFFGGWGAYVFAGALAALLSAFLLTNPSLLTAFQAAGGGAIYGLFVGWIVGFASLGGYRGTRATTTVKEA